ncbi:hypothetical protein ZIOFF_045832 [Zingiber officinale]|uniref:Uncharacterized protein n=1 Tax=Zingiber officinale TaxID=94328 RepID=A0A8J5G1P3_ZINOF|nr:hypothetical protein ZIOFF_045832 [Zingiber officinale]
MKPSAQPKPHSSPSLRQKLFSAKTSALPKPCLPPSLRQNLWSSPLSAKTKPPPKPSLFLPETSISSQNQAPTTTYISPKSPHVPSVSSHVLLQFDASEPIDFGSEASPFLCIILCFFSIAFVKHLVCANVKVKTTIAASNTSKTVTNTKIRAKIVKKVYLCPARSMILLKRFVISKHTILLCCNLQLAE